MKRGAPGADGPAAKRGRDAKPSTAPSVSQQRRPAGGNAAAAAGGLEGQLCTGRIARYESAKGWGFIAPDRDLNGDVFFLRQELPQHLHAASNDQVIDNRVEFEIAP